MALSGDDTAVLYVGGFAAIEVLFAGHTKKLYFARGIPRLVPPEFLTTFKASPEWLLLKMGTPHPTRKVIAVRRTAGLGDMIATHGAMMGLKSHFPDFDFVFQVSEIHKPFFASHPGYIHVADRMEPIPGGPFHSVVCLDGVLEWDHRKDGQKISRVTRAMNSIVKEVPEFQGQEIGPIFDLQVPLDVQRWAEEKTRRLPRPIIALAPRSQSKQRQPAFSAVKQAATALMSKLRGSVVLIEFSPDFIWTAAGIHGFPQSSALQALALVKQADILVTPDGGALWLAHVARKPTVAWLGPTPPETKLQWHPLRSEGGIRAICTNTWIDCPACYEAAEACDWKFTCLRSLDVSRFVNETVKATEELWEKYRATN